MANYVKSHNSGERITTLPCWLVTEDHVGTKQTTRLGTRYHVIGDVSRIRPPENGAYRDLGIRWLEDQEREK